MVNKIIKVIFVLFGIALMVYLAWPAPQFPKPLSDFYTSTEPADKETPLRRGYYTNLTRDQIVNHYASEFNWGERLNYPPEEAQTIIRDQTKATYLEEIVHPMRESIYIAGNVVQSDKDPFEINSNKFRQKVIVKYVGSNIFVRLGIGILTLSLMWILYNQLVLIIRDYIKVISRLR